MFNLDQAIAEWRRQMIGAGIKSPVPLEELESHLRDEVQAQIRAGMASERAFALAVGQMGNVDNLKTEFAKVEETRKMRSRENLRRLSVGLGAAFVYSTLSLAWYLGVRSGKMEIAALDIVLAVGAMVPMILFGWVGRSLAKFLPVINQNWIVVLTIGALAFAAGIFRIIFPAVSPTNLVHLQIFMLWSLSPLIGFGNFVSAWFDRCAELRKKAA